MRVHCISPTYVAETRIFDRVVSAGGGLVFAFGLVLFAAHLAWQVVRLDIGDPVNCLVVFKSNRDAGLILFAALAADAVAPLM